MAWLWAVEFGAVTLSERFRFLTVNRSLFQLLPGFLSKGVSPVIFSVVFFYTNILNALCAQNTEGNSLKENSILCLRDREGPLTKRPNCRLIKSLIWTAVTLGASAEVQLASATKLPAITVTVIIALVVIDTEPHSELVNQVIVLSCSWTKAVSCS